MPFEDPSGTLWRLSVALIVGGVFAYATHRARLLTGPAALLGGALGASIVGFGGWAWIGPALLFFGSAAAVSRWDRARKRQPEASEAEGRDARQVLANGGVAWALLLAAPWIGEVLCFWGFVGAFAAAAADTWATEVGTAAGAAPRSLRTLRRVPAGTSGAVTGVGALAALGGAAVVAAGAWPVAPRFLPPAAPALAAVLLATGAGLAGAVADSLAGAFLQARYRSAQTGRLTEQAFTAGRKNQHVSGVPFLTNDGVNVLCTAVGAAGAMSGTALL